MTRTYVLGTHVSVSTRKNTSRNNVFGSGPGTPRPRWLGGSVARRPMGLGPRPRSARTVEAARAHVRRARAGTRAPSLSSSRPAARPRATAPPGLLQEGKHESTRRHLRGLAGACGAGQSAGVVGAREGKGGAACAARHARALALLGLVRRAHRPQQRCLHREARWQSERPRDAQSWRARAGGFEWTHGAPAARYRRP